MVHPRTRSKRFARLGAAVGLALMCPAPGAAGDAWPAAASAATLHVSVPATIEQGKTFAISVRGTFRKSETANGRAFLISVIQFSPKACLASAQAEARSRRRVRFYLAPDSDPARGPVGDFESRSPFTNNTAFTAGRLGVRHVCAWLYPSFIRDPTVPTAPIATADERYEVTHQ